MKRGLFLTLLFSVLLVGTTFAQDSEPKLTIVKFSDYQCPACKYYKGIIELAKQDFGDDIKVVYKNFPLRMHQFAELAARAAEAAKKQGKFDEMHEMIFTGQEQWSRGNAQGIFIGYAQQMKLDMEMFKQDLNSAQMNRIVLADKREGISLGVNSTPTIYINGEKIERLPRTYDGFKAILEARLK